MDRLFTPWRYAYISTAAKTEVCLFCQAAGQVDDRKAFVVQRGQHAFVMLNAFPYTSGHVMIAPYAHVDQFDKLDAATAQEIARLMQRTETVLRQAYSPDGMNFGMNLGRAAGAGVAGHVHLHALPRWFGDTNFMTTTSETRVLPEALETTWEKLRRGYQGVA